MASLDFFIDTKNRRLLSSFTSRSSFVIPDFYSGDSGITIRLHLLEPTTTGSIDRPYQYLSPSGLTFKFGIGLVDQAPTSGTFTVTDPAASQTTAAIAYNASASTVQTALRAALTTNYGSCTVTGSDGGAWTVDRVTTGVLADELTGSGTLLSPDSFVGVLLVREGAVGISKKQRIRLVQKPAAFAEPATTFPAAAVTVTTIQAGSATLNEIQRVTINSDTYAGTFTITCVSLGASNNTTAASGAIPYNATADEAQTIIRTNFGTGNEVTVTSSGINSWDIEFTGTNVLKKNITQMTGDATGLSVPVGVSGTLSLNTSQTIEILGNSASASAVLEIEQTLSGNVTTLVHETCTLINDLIDPESTGATELPTYLTESDVMDIVNAITNYDSTTVSTAGTTTLTPAENCKVFTQKLIASAGSGTYSRNFDLSATNRKKGDTVFIRLEMAASVNPTIVIRNGPTSSTLSTVTGTGVAFNWWGEFVMTADASNWELVNSG